MGFRNKKIISDQAEELMKMNKQLDEEQKKDYQPGGQLLVKFYAKDATASDVRIDYIVPHAGWSPTPDRQIGSEMRRRSECYPARCHSADNSPSMANIRTG